MLFIVYLFDNTTQTISNQLAQKLTTYIWYCFQDRVKNFMNINWRSPNLSELTSHYKPSGLTHLGCGGLQLIDFELCCKHDV